MEPQPQERQSSVPEPAPLRRLGARRLARAHLALSKRPQVGRWAQEALEHVVRELSQELGCEVRGSAQLLEAVVVPEEGLAHSAAYALVELAAVGGTAVLELEPPLLLAVLERLLGAGQKPGPVTELTRLEEAALVYLCLSALGALRRQEPLQRSLALCLTGVTMSRAEVLARVGARERHLAVELEVAVGPVPTRGRLLLPAAVLESAVRALPMERDTEVAPQVLAAALEVRCRAGRTSLSLEALEGLAAGDVVLLDGLRRGGARLEGAGRLLARGFELEGRFGPEGFSLECARRRVQSLESTMESVNERSEGMPPLPVDVEVELTRLMLPVSELAVLKPGAVLPLHMGASGPVLLRVGDRVVARAELVDLEGEVGARILTLLP